ncbi:MAG: exodeoxyribonuclease VII large subunit [Clostridia bacterium]|nr:exodeoxyribonuclease VII large subunit [Clostridia bacterium]
MSEITFTVSELNEFLKISFDESKILRDIYIRGEISNFTNHFKTGHYYFTLKDSDSSLKAVMFRMYTRNIDFIPQNGMKIIAHGKIDVFVRDGTYSLKVDNIIPEGVGSVFLSYEQLKDKLDKEGLFSQEHKRALPPFPQKIGVLTSATGAVIRDICNVASRRYPLCEIINYPVSVQGDKAVTEIIAGIKHFEDSDVDIIIIARGGGSLEDLMPFNDEKLARKIYACAKPVISAVGHETDFTICDFVSDLRAPTPSAAAELAVPSLSELMFRLDNYRVQIKNSITDLIDRKNREISQLSQKSVLSKPFAVIDEIEKNINVYSELLKNNINNIFEYKKKVLDGYDINNKMTQIINIKKLKLAELTHKTEALSPLSVISRGYSVVYKNDIIVNDVIQLGADDEIRIRMSNGNVIAEVKEVEQI